MQKKIMFVVAAAMGLSFATSGANAVPSFASKTEKNCSYCHTAWPQLNAKGRAYKEAGYRLPAEVGKDTGNFLEQGEFPISAVLFTRPYDKKDSGDHKVRALHEAEVIVAASIGKNLSGFFELEAEDEDTNARGLEIGIPQAQITYSYSPEFNAQVSYGEMFYADPYGFLGDHFRLTRGHVGVIDQSFGGADGRLRSRRQNVTVYGRVQKKFFYMAGYSGPADDAEGVDAGTFLVRGAYDIMENVMVGGFYVNGDNGTAGREFTRTGIDFSADYQNFRIAGAWVTADDDTDPLFPPVTETSNTAMSVQGSYFVRSKSGRPTMVPTVRWDRYEKNDGADEYSELTLNFAFYPLQYAKIYLEYWDRFDVPDGMAEDSRVTLQAAIAF